MPAKHTKILSALRLAIAAMVVLLLCASREAVRLAPAQPAARAVAAQNSLRRAPSPARATVDSAHKASALLLTRAPASARLHVTSVQRKTPVAPGVHCPAAAAVLRAELSLRRNLSIAHCGQSASLTAVPPPLS